MMKLKVPALLVSAIIVAGIAGLGQSGSAQTINLTTSADKHENRFFGGILQGVIIDPEADDDNNIEEVFIDIEAEPDIGSSNSIDIAVPETNKGSGRFEFFLVHVDADEIEPAVLDPINSAGVEGDGSCIDNCAPIVTFGPGGDLDIDVGRYEKVRFEIIIANTEVVVAYEETVGSLRLDRDSYGSSSYVYVSVVDQDANLNPTGRDQFTVDPDGGPNNDLLVLDGGTLEEVVVFKETGYDTGVFEGRYRLGVSMIASTEALVLTLHEKANYGAALAAAENDSKNIDEIGFTIGNTKGTVILGGGQTTQDPSIEGDKNSYAPGDTVQVTIIDQDADINSGSRDSILLQVSSGSSSIQVSAFETGVNTGIFEATFRLAEETDSESGEIAPGGSAKVSYTDRRPADYSEKVQAGQNPEKDFTLEIDIQLPVKTGVEATDVSAPVARDVAGGAAPYALGDSITLSTVVSNNNYEPQPFVALIEVRDSTGSTIFLALQDGMLDPSGHAEIGVLWRPDRTGTFEIRTFVVTGLGVGGEVQSPVASSKIKII